jgi:carbamoyl-phosphate synthase large subunit
MKSVGETMAIGRTFKEALQKGLRSLEIGRYGLGADGKDGVLDTLTSSREEQADNGESLKSKIREKLQIPQAERLFYLKYAFQIGMEREEVAELTGIDPWFLHNIEEIIEMEKGINSYLQSQGFQDLRDKGPLFSSYKSKASLPRDLLLKAKQFGFSDIQLAHLLGVDEDAIRKLRKDQGIGAVFKLVDTCAAEFEAYTPYYYSTYEEEDESRRTDQKKIIILGGGPNRIGQGIEFDYCCVHASFALKELGYETIMINSNPETVSTDYDTSSKLYFEPLTLEDVLTIVEKEKPDGVIVQFGGQTPLNLAVPLEKAKAPIIGTSPDNIDRAEDRGRFKALLKKLNLNQPPNDVATTFEEARIKAKTIGYPVIVRPSYVLGGRAMNIVYHEKSLEDFITHAIEASPQHPILIDKFLEDAIEIDADAVADGKECIIAGILEHIEEAGIHSGDSACVIPPYTLGDEIIETIKESTKLLAKELQVIGLMNIQYAVKNDVLYVLEVNPRASRTVPFVSKATGVAWAKIAAKIMAGKKLSELGIKSDYETDHVSVKESVFPFKRFPGIDPVLGPEMKSTGEVMGIDSDFGKAYAKSQIAAGQILPTKGRVFISVRNKDKRSIIFVAKKLADLGFSLVATTGTAKVLVKNGLEVTSVLKIGGGRPNIADMIKNGEIGLTINTPSGREAHSDQLSLRSLAVMYNVPYITTISGASAAVNGIEFLQKGEIEVKALQDYHKGYKE